jgi:hypothetical protein
MSSDREKVYIGGKSQKNPMTSGQQFLAVYNILNAIHSRYTLVSELSALDLAFIIADFGYEFVKIPEAR